MFTQTRFFEHTVVRRTFSLVGLLVAATVGPRAVHVLAESPTESPTELPEFPPVAADIDLDEENYKSWRDHILPETSELAWEKIPWLTTFKDGIDAAYKAGKPLLLWTMNGHPLGCT